MSRSLRPGDSKKRYQFFFFKQQTAYEIPKRDWSSDVCSSGLSHPPMRDQPKMSMANEVIVSPPMSAAKAASRLQAGGKARDSGRVELGRSSNFPMKKGATPRIGRSTKHSLSNALPN